MNGRYEIIEDVSGQFILVDNNLKTNKNLISIKLETQLLEHHNTDLKVAIVSILESMKDRFIKTGR